ncbi:hypothetical protein Leryth_024279 [Lithospermum erythrorhizon]|nr:hypothetical protein Leryth_024279 [Lithospermum erythrorhizon]
MKKGMCELCNKKARLHCESDEATLCWECDEKVHGANFLVAKHCRSLLCHVCQTPTPWKASGQKLFPTISICEKCNDNKNSRTEEDEEINKPHIRNQENEVFDETESEDDDDGNQEFSSDDDDDDDDQEVEDDDDGEDDEGENQVVPWSSSPSMANSSSCSDEEVAAEGGFSVVSSTLKRIHQTDYLDPTDDERSLSEICGISSETSLRPWKLARN